MTNNRGKDERREGAKFWDTHGIDEGLEERSTDDPQEEVEVRKPLATVLSVRLDDDDLLKLKLIAKAQRVGTTTMARMLLHQCLENPKNQLVLQALRSDGVRSEIADILEDPKIPPGEGEPEFFVLSKARLDNIGSLVHEMASRMLVEALKEQSVSVRQNRGDLYEKLRQLEAVEG